MQTVNFLEVHPSNCRETAQSHHVRLYGLHAQCEHVPYCFKASAPKSGNLLAKSIWGAGVFYLYLFIYNCKAWHNLKKELWCTVCIRKRFDKCEAHTWLTVIGWYIWHFSSFFPRCQIIDFFFSDGIWAYDSAPLGTQHVKVICPLGFEAPPMTPPGFWHRDRYF